MNHQPAEIFGIYLQKSEVLAAQETT